MQIVSKYLEYKSNKADEKIKNDFVKRILNMDVTKSPLVTVCIVTNGEFCERVWESVNNQDYSNYNVVIYKNTQPINMKGLPTELTHSYQCSANRERAKKLILGTDSEYVLFVDMDTVIPPNTIRELVIQSEHSKWYSRKKPVKVMTVSGMKKEVKRRGVYAGWCKLKNNDDYIGGQWVGDNTLGFFKKMHKGITRTDVIPMGCTLFPVEVLRKLTIFPGERCFNLDYGIPTLSDECSQVPVELQNMGYECYLDSNIVCEHLNLEEMNESRRCG